MDLLEAVLTAAGADKYVEKFREEKIDAHSLKQLCDEDLKMFGIDDEEIRKNILEKSDRMIFHSKKKVDIVVNKDYAKVVLLHMANIMKLHQANLYCGGMRPDIINWNIQLGDAVDSFVNNITACQHSIHKLRKQKQCDCYGKRFNRKPLILATLLTTALFTSLFVYWKINV